MLKTKNIVSAYRHEGEYLRDICEGGVQSAKGRQFFKREYPDFILINRARLLRAQTRNANPVETQQIVNRSVLNGFTYRGKVVPKLVIGG